MRRQKKEEGELPFGIEDLLYYIRRVEEQQFDLDFGAVKLFFPVNLVLSGIFKVSQDLFGNYIFSFCIFFKERNLKIRSIPNFSFKYALRSPLKILISYMIISYAIFASCRFKI